MAKTKADNNVEQPPTHEGWYGDLPEYDPNPEEPKAKAGPTFTTKEGQTVISVAGVNGDTHYAWRKDGEKPVVNLQDFARSKHAALTPNGTADFASSVKPE
jgi:hypothetical protein